MRLAYIVDIFEKKPDGHIGSFEIPNLSDDEYRKIFGIPDEEDVCGCYPIKLEHLDKLRKFTTENFDLDKYNYYIELLSLKE